MTSALVKSLCLSLLALGTCLSVSHIGVRAANEVRVLVQGIIEASHNEKKIRKKKSKKKIII